MNSCFQCGGGIGYPVLVFYALMVCLSFRYLLVSELDWVFEHFGTSSSCASILDSDAKFACFGNQFVYRMSFAFVLFFAMMIPLVACFRLRSHNGGWLAKILLIHSIFIASCWISDEAMAGFASLCLVGSGIFIAMQAPALAQHASRNPCHGRSSKFLTDGPWTCRCLRCWIGHIR